MDYHVTKAGESVGRLGHVLDADEGADRLTYRQFDEGAKAEIEQLKSDHQEIEVIAGFDSGPDAPNPIVRFGEPGWFDAFVRILRDHGYELEPIESG